MVYLLLHSNCQFSQTFVLEHMADTNFHCKIIALDYGFMHLTNLTEVLMDGPTILIACLTCAYYNFPAEKK